MVVVDNGSTDGSPAAVRAEFPEVTLLELGENLGFGPALNRAVAAHPADAIVLLNSDVECEPGFCEALLGGLGEGVEMVAGVLLQEREPELIDSAGVVADRTLMGFDYLHGEPVAAAAGAADPLGPTGGAALYRRAAWEAVGGFDERIFLYYEDLDLALRIAARGGRCRLAPGARALHAYSAGPRRGERRQVRPHRLEPRLHAAPLRGDAGPGGGAAGARGRGRDRRRPAAARPHGRGSCGGACGASAPAPASSAATPAPPRSSTSAPARRSRSAAAAALGVRTSPTTARGYVAGRGANRASEPGAGAGEVAGRGEPAALAEGRGRRARPSSLPRRVARRRRSRAAFARAPASTAAIRGSDEAGMNLAWVTMRLRATRRAFQAPGFGASASQEALPTCQTTASGT